MTISRLQSLALRLGNQCFVRHYLWLNFPQDPQLMGIQFTEPASAFLAKELITEGFTLNEHSGIWTILRSD